MSTTERLLNSMQDGTYDIDKPDSHTIEDLIDVIVKLSYDIEYLQRKLEESKL